MEQAFIDLFNQYQGKVTITNDKIGIISNNLVASHYENGEICHSNKESCYIEIKIDLVENFKYVIVFGENSYEILGGGSRPSNDIQEIIDEARRVLERYNFSKKEEPVSYDLWGKAIYV